MYKSLVMRGEKYLGASQLWERGVHIVYYLNILAIFASDVRISTVSTNHSNDCKTFRRSRTVAYM